MKFEPDDLEPDEKIEQSNGPGVNVLWYVLVAASIVFMLVGIFAGNPFIDYQTASNL